MKREEPTIELTCTNCDVKFLKTVAEYKRRLSKLPDSTNFFCTKSCSAIHGNKHRVGGGGHLVKYRYKLGDTGHQLYDQNFTWYIHRLTNDHRRNLKYTGDRVELQTTLQELWEAQHHRCAITNVSLTLRVGAKGACETNNSWYVASIDRVDNTLPYQLGNIQWVSTAINVARGKTDNELFKTHLVHFLKDVNKNPT